MKTPALSLALLSTLALSLSAQESPLVLRTSSPEVAMSVAVMLGSFQPPPALDPGDHYVLTLGEAGIDVTTGSGDAGLLKAVVKPAPLMELFSDDLAEAQGLIQGSLMMSLGQQGMKPADIASMAQAVMDFPKQVETLNLEVTGDPASFQQGFRAEIGLAPIQGSWLASVVDSVSHVSSGAPVIADEGASLQMIAGVDMESWEPLEPLLDLLSGVGASSEEDREKRREMMRQAYTNVTGAMSMSWNLEGGGMQIISGVRDAKAAAELLSDPAYQELTMSFGTGGIEMDYEPGAFEHRGVKVHKMTMDMGMENPFAPSGAMESYYAIAGNYSLATTYAEDEAAVKGLIDMVLDGNVKLAPLPGDTLANMSMDFTAFVNMFGGGVPMGEMPEGMSLELAKSNGQLVVVIDVK